MSFTDQIRGEIQQCGASRYRIAQASGVSQVTLCKFMAGSGMHYSALDRVAAVLGLSVFRDPSAAAKLAATPDKRRKETKGRGTVPRRKGQ